jgi:UDP-N-acetylmuramyl pentapeptide phosphotransferase/UDP-N-acetylglucosamine-1-phosphate transferase
MPHAPIAAVVLALVVAAIGVAVLRLRAAALPPDIPNARSLHVVPVPRAGGYAVWLGFLPVALLFPPAFPGGLAGWLPPWVALAVVSARDDVREVGIAARLLVHAVAGLWTAVALAFALGVGPLAGAALAVPLALVIAWAANLYNFMDGSDGLAGLMGAIGFAAYGAIALALHGGGAAVPYFALAAALLPFLAVNAPPARLFLGDVGAVPLGFLAAAFGIAGVAAGDWDAWFPLLVFLPFAADASVTLAVRIARRERWWEGHRTHYYQRLAQLGVGHGGTLRVYAALMLGGAATAVTCRLLAPAIGAFALALWLAVVLIVFSRIDYHWRNKTKTSQGHAAHSHTRK